MVRPDNGDEAVPFSARWTTLVNALLVESSVKLVAKAACDHANRYDVGEREAGGDTYPGNERLVRMTSLSERSVRTAWAVMRGLGMAELVEASYYDPIKKRRKADDYRLVIPDNWASLPILGPSMAKFRCLHCASLMNPDANCKVDSKGVVTFDVTRFCFCKAPRNSSKGVGCYRLWTKERDAAGLQRWRDLDAWKLFRESRGEDW
jgi:hypothetical protein